MLPTVPPATIRDIAIEHYREFSPVTHRSTAADADRLFLADELTPDPVFMGLRGLITRGPVGRLLHAIERRIEEREERRYGTAPAAGGEVAPLTRIEPRDHPDSDVAA